LSVDQSERRTPNYWASLVVIGSVDALDFNHISVKAWFALGLILTLGLGFLLIKKINFGK
jgi:hypothetical protein